MTSIAPGVFDWNFWGIQSGMRWLQRVNAAYGVNKYVVSSWSPPAWMKDNNSCTNGGHVLPAQYANLAALKIQWLNNVKAQLGFEGPGRERAERAQHESDVERTGKRYAYRTSASENQAQLSALGVFSGAFTITVPAKSVVTVVG